MSKIAQTDIAANRNKEPIFETAQPFFQWADHVFEIGTGSGIHADYFLSQLPDLMWQPSDIAENIARINDFFAERPTQSQVTKAIEFTLPVDTIPPNLKNKFDMVYTSNTLHIMSWQAVQSLLNRIPDLVNADGFFICYGPFLIDGEMSDSNHQFDAMLKNRAPHQGIRELRDLEKVNTKLSLLQATPMPANNYLLVWEV